MGKENPNLAGYGGKGTEKKKFLPWKPRVWLAKNLAQPPASEPFLPFPSSLSVILCGALPTT
jgi:hypothetical protein